MKKSAFAAAAIALTALTLGSCAPKNNNATDEAAATDTTATAAERTPVDPGEAFTPTTNIRYYVLDSVMNNYELVKTFNEANLKTMTNLENTQRNYESQIQKKAADIQAKVQSNSYSQASYETDMNDLNDLQQRAQNHMAHLQQKAQEESLRQQNEFIDSIENFLVTYNRDHHFDAILVSSPGTYFNPALNITDEIVAGLNARYLKAHPSKSEAK